LDTGLRIIIERKSPHGFTLLVQLQEYTTIKAKVKINPMSLVLGVISLIILSWKPIYDSSITIRCVGAANELIATLVFKNFIVANIENRVAMNAKLFIHKFWSILKRVVFVEVLLLIGNDYFFHSFNLVWFALLSRDVKG